MEREKNKLRYIKYVLPLMLLLALTFCQQASEEVVVNNDSAVTIDSNLAFLMKTSVQDDDANDDGDDDGDDDQCIEFQYPIGMYVYYATSRNIETYIINTDEELIDFFNLLTSGDQISIDFPIVLKTTDGEDITINDKTELEQTLQTAIDACHGDDDDYDYCDSNHKKVNVCHNGNTICISISALQTHLDHGDTLGECD